MLLELKVSNFAIIDNVHIQFRSGLNILSGETGAGKSILLKSLGLLMGEKAASESVRTGAEQAVIEGRFDVSTRPDIKSALTDMGIEIFDDQLVVRRLVSIHANKSRVYLNGGLSTLSGLRDLVAPLVEVTGQATPLIEMTGQHENRNLMSRAYHLDVLDQYTGVYKARIEFAQLFAQLNELMREIETIQNESRTRAQRLDFLIFQRDEIKSLGLKAGEEDELENETKRLKHSTRLSEFATQAEEILYAGDDSVSTRIHYVLQRASELKNVDPSLAAKLEPLSQARTLINETSYELRDYTKRLEADPSRLDELQERLSRLRQLQRKYGTSTTEILAALEGFEREIHQLENADESLVEKQKQLRQIETELKVRAADMHERRSAGAKLLEKGVNDELKDLNMKGLEFIVQVTRHDQMTSTGDSQVEFLTRASRRDAPRTLAKSASGGELSRILLAMKQVVGASEFPRTYLFDEVDAGVSGTTAEKVGRKLKEIAKGQQVICVTHLPQVASFGDTHFSIQKSQQKSGVQTEVVELKTDQRIEEIARLISGEKITATSLAHARQLLADSH